MYNILVFSGLLFGKLLGYFTREEIKAGKKYFLLVEKILLMLFVLSLLVKSNFLGVVIGLIIGYFLRNMLFLGFGVFLSNYLSMDYGLFISSLVFLYLLVFSREIKWLGVVENIGFFLLPLVLLPLGESFINANLGLFLGISAGGPVAQLGRTFLRKKRSRKK